MALPLDTTITEGQAGHIDDHVTIAETLNDLGTAAYEDTVNLATATGLTNHINDTTSHAASSVTVVSTTIAGTGTDAQTVLEEIDASVVAHLADTSAAHAASAISASSATLVGTGTDVQAVLEELDNGIADHLADAVAAHAATAVSADSTTLVGTGITVQAVLEELDNGIVDHAALTAAVHGITSTAALPQIFIDNGASGYIALTAHNRIYIGTADPAVAVVGGRDSDFDVWVDTTP